MHHLLAHYGSLGNTANTEIDGIADPIINKNTNAVYFPGRNYELMAAYAFGAQLLRARLYTPRVRGITPVYALPIYKAAAPEADARVADFRDNPFLLRQSEEIKWEISNSAAGPTATYVLNWIRQQFVPAPQGEIFTLRGTSSTASVANAWTLLTTTWDDTLPQGEWAIVGGHYSSASGLAFRLSIEGQNLRPGGLGFATEGLAPWKGQLNGGLGLWGTFTTVAYPQVEVLNSGTPTDHVIYLQLIRVS